MALLEIRQYPDPVLRKRCRPVVEITPDIQRLIDDMVETMYAAPGVGLAAPQVGVSLRLVVVDIGREEEGDPDSLMVLINPEMVYQEGEFEEDEGCLSIKGFSANVTRAAFVRVRATDRHGRQFEVEGEGYLAKAFQHELDHIDGRLFIDRLSPLKRDLFKRRLKKDLKREEAEVS